MKQLYTIVIIILFLAVLTGAITVPASASEKTAASSALLTSVIEEKKEDSRITQLKSFLDSYNSPLAVSAQTFIEEADKNNLDWRLVVAISGVESGFGKRIPANSYNGWGWGIYGGKVTRFTSWEEGVITISHDLREKYMNRWGATDIYSMGRIYASSPTWAQKVQYFMNKIENFEEKPTLAALPISL